MGCINSILRWYSQPTNPSTPNSPAYFSANPIEDPIFKEGPRYTNPKYAQNNKWAVLNQGPSKRDGIAQRRREQLELEKLVRTAKFGPDIPLVNATTKTQTLSSRSLSAVAEYILKNPPKNIVILAGAGISTSAGIPDFRTPGTGFYSNLSRLKIPELPNPEAMFDLSFFRKNPNPFYIRAKELYPGKFQPTISHAFFALLHEKKMLKMLFTQNIDCLESQAGVPGDFIVAAHGSFATQSCIDCKVEFPRELMEEAIETGVPARCLVPECNGLVKPDIIFFGEQLPERFHEKCELIATADLVIVMGSSLSVAPFSSLPSLASEGTPRVLFNMHRVGDLGTRPDDVVVLGDCDVSVRIMAEALGWMDELEGLWRGCSGRVPKQAVKLSEVENTVPPE